MLSYTYYKDRDEWPRFSPLKKSQPESFNKAARDKQANKHKTHHFSYGKSRKCSML